MSIAILTALIAGAVCLGIVSGLMPLGRRADEEDEAFGVADEFFDIGSLRIDMKRNSKPDG